MTILLLGDGHIYGYGLRTRQLSYTGHFIRQLSRTGRSVSIEAYAHLTLTESIAMLKRLPLNQYDLILLQLGPELVSRTAAELVGAGHQATRSILCQPALNDDPLRPGRRKRLGSTLRALVDIAISFVPLVRHSDSLRQLLALLRPYRHNVLLMTPFPCQPSVDQWVRRRSRAVLLHMAVNRAFSVFDTSAIVRPSDEYFQTADQEYLNAVSHELIGQALFDFYQSAPTIVTIQTINPKPID